MSMRYAKRFSCREVGSVGMSEIFDSPHVLQEKIAELAEMIKQQPSSGFHGSRNINFLWNPDFRGPDGVWTLQSKGEAIPEAAQPFHRAMPAITHMALAELEKAGILKCVISQNVDINLHLQSGIPWEKLAELHGNSFRETCPNCDKEYFRDFEIETIGMKITPRRCNVDNCKERLRDSVVDWTFTNNSSCKPSFAMSPWWGKIVIVNLQPTPKDTKARLIIHGHVDKAAESKIKSYEVEVSSLKLEIREMSEKLEVINAKAQSFEREARMMEQEKLHLEEKYRSEFERFDEVHERCKIAEREAKRSNEVAEKERAEATAARKAKSDFEKLAMERLAVIERVQRQIESLEREKTDYANEVNRLRGSEMEAHSKVALLEARVEEREKGTGEWMWI